MSLAEPVLEFLVFHKLMSALSNMHSAYIIEYTFLLFADASCMAEKMGFQELFNHLGQYVKDREQRWKVVMRIKRGLENPDALGGYGNDQVYFEGVCT